MRFNPSAALLTLSTLLLSSCSHDHKPAEVVYEHAPTYYHTVKEGESIASIAARYGMDKNDVIRLNGLKLPYRLVTGQRLLVIKRGLESAQTSSSVNTVSTPPMETIDAGGVDVSPLAPPPGMSAQEPFSSTPDTESAAVGAPPSTMTPSALDETPMPPTPASTGTMTWPVQGEIIRDFSSLNGKRDNDGINIKAAVGTPVKAADNGVVAFSGNQLKGFGNFVLIKHDQGLRTVYTHLDEIRVKNGDVVQRGQVIGTVGATGNVKTPQVHFQVRRGKTPIDPKPLLQGANQGVSSAGG